MKIDHVQNLINNDTAGRFKKLDNPEGLDIYLDTYTGKHFLYDTCYERLFGRSWFNLLFVASIQKRIWENWDELKTPRDEAELEYLDANPDFSVQLVSSNGIVYYVWFCIDEREKSLYITTERPSDDG